MIITGTIVILWSSWVMTVDCHSVNKLIAITTLPLRKRIPQKFHVTKYLKNGHIGG